MFIKTLVDMLVSGLGKVLFNIFTLWHTWSNSYKYNIHKTTDFTTTYYLRQLK